MDQPQFWQLIEQSKQACGNHSQQQKLFLVQALSQSSLADMLDFEHFLIEYRAMAYTSHLWAAAYIVLGGCSDDWFDYFRAWLVAQGKETFEGALFSPESLLEPIKSYFQVGDEPVFEEMLYVASDSYEMQTGRDDFWTLYHGKYGQIATRPDIEFDWDESPESLQRLMPTLFAEFS